MITELYMKMAFELLVYLLTIYNGLRPYQIEVGRFIRLPPYDLPSLKTI